MATAGKREKQEAKLDLEEGNDDESRSWETGLGPSSDDDEEANEDWSLTAAEKALLMRAAKLKAENDAISDISKDGDDVGLEVEDTAGPNGVSGGVIVGSEIKGKIKISKVEIGDETVTIAREVEKMETIKADVIEIADPNAVDITENIILRKLLRGPRYFDSPGSDWGICYNCGEEGHRAVNCTLVKRKKPCYFCGSSDHRAKRCSKSKGQDCFICKKAGHRAKDCPEREKGGSQSFKICLKCAGSGHDMFSCRNNYSPDSLKEIQCYVCKSFGHLCCVDAIDNGPRVVSCYKCGELGHTGMACPRLHGGTTGEGSLSSCYKCGEEGHFVRECPSSAKVGKRNCELSTPNTRFSKGKNNLGFQSAPHDLGMARKREKNSI